MHAWIDGRLLPDATTPALPVTDRGASSGDGLFETLKVLDGRVVALSAHLARLHRSAEQVGLPATDDGYLRQGVAAVLAAEHLELGRLRITVTARPGATPTARDPESMTVVVTAAPATPPQPAARVVTSPWTRNPDGPLAGHKSTSYAENVVALEHGRRVGADEVVLADTRGHLCEGTTTNVFYAVGGELRTPTLASGCLPGITRALVLDWVGARELDEPLEEVRERADEVFLTSSGRDVQPVASWDERELDWPGPATTEAMRIWAEREQSVLEDPE